MNRKIKVAHTISRVISGGAEENTLFTLKGLDKQKYSIDLIVGKDFNKDLFEWNKNENSVNIIQIRKLLGPLNFFYDPIVFYKMLKIFKKNKYDIVHTHTTKTGILGRIAAKFTGVPIIICGLHGSAFQAFNSNILNWALIYLERLAGKFTDAYISVSNILTEKYKKERIGENSKYFTVLSGMDLNKFADIKNKINVTDIKRELNIAPDSFIIGNVARLEPVKGHRYLIDAFKIAKDKKKDKNIVLIIAGEGGERVYLEQYIRKIGLTDSIVFTGYRSDIEKVMAIMDIFVLSSLREGLPRVLVQASSAEIPSVAFNIDGVADIIRDGYNGLLVNQKDIEGMAENIIKYIDNEDLRRIHGKNGKSLVEGKWSVETMVAQIDSIYQGFIKEKIVLQDI